MSEECCSVLAASPSPGDCPSCGTRGKPVGSETLSSLLKEPARARVEGDGYRFCSVKGCDVVYFRPGEDSRFFRSELAVPVWQKETDPSCLVCYCFNHSAASIGDEIRRTGKSTVLADIKQKVQERLCACESKNPQGTCCLGNVGAVVKQELAGHGDSASGSITSIGPEPAAGHSGEPSVVHACCGVSERRSAAAASDVRAVSASKTSRILAGSLVSALAASACCWLPLALGGLGLSAAGAGAVFERWRPLFLGLTGLLLAVGFYLTYFRREACEPGSSCTVPDPRTRRLGRVGLWLATFLVVATAAFPHYAATLTEGTEPPAAVAAGSVARHVVLSIAGMSCEACTAHVHKALLGVPGVLEAAVDYPTKTAQVGFAASGSEPNLQELNAAIRKAGYQARPLNTGRAQSADPCCSLWK